jgi:hypothetical protein
MLGVGGVLRNLTAVAYMKTGQSSRTPPSMVQIRCVVRIGGRGHSGRC